MCAGFPCQPFSAAREGRHVDMASDLHLVKHAEFGMVKSMIRAVRAFQPASIVFENVPGFDCHVSGFEMTPKEDMMKELRSAGYIVVSLRMNLSDWVKANRDR